MLRDDTRRRAIRMNAYRLGRDMVWSNVARLYMRSFELSQIEGAARSRKSLATKTLDQKPRELPELKLSHLSRMTDSTGIFQHAILTVPWNDLGLELCSPKTGGCRDGLHVDRVNRNQGAESTLAFLPSLAEMRLAQNMLASFKEPIAA